MLDFVGSIHSANLPALCALLAIKPRTPDGQKSPLASDLESDMLGL
jgi:hypothetical protein